MGFGISWATSSEGEHVYLPFARRDELLVFLRVQTSYCFVPRSAVICCSPPTVLRTYCTICWLLNKRLVFLNTRLCTDASSMLTVHCAWSTIRSITEHDPWVGSLVEWSCSRKRSNYSFGVKGPLRSTLEKILNKGIDIHSWKWSDDALCRKCRFGNFMFLKRNDNYLCGEGLWLLLKK